MPFASAIYPGHPTATLVRPLYILLLLCLLASGCASSSGHRPGMGPSDHKHGTQKPYVINNRRYFPIPSAEGYEEQGIASWYGPNFHGKTTSNGEIYNMHAMTAAHKTLPMNTMLLIRNLENGRKTVVRVNDRGPFVRGRIIDLSYRAAQEIGIAEKGIARVQVTALGEESGNQQGESPILVHQDLSAGEFYVQIGAFNEQNNAARLQKRFTDAGFATVVQQAVDQDSTIYRVQVYAGRSLADAKRSEKALLDRGYTGAFTVAR
jgi:peptidoglycan lytic transglycosylase